MSINPYQACPVFESERFVYRLIQEQDAIDLLECYSDIAAIPLFNSDNCHNDFEFSTIEEMSSCLRYWLYEYEQQGFVRLSIVEKMSNKASGTIEFFARKESLEGVGVIGVLRLDLISKLEIVGCITEILSMIEKEFYDCFTVNVIITKAIPLAGERVISLLNTGYQKIEGNSLLPYNDYYVKARAFSEGE